MSWDRMLLLNTLTCISREKRVFFFPVLFYLDCRSQKVVKYESKGSDIWPFGVNVVTVKERACINTYTVLHTQTSILVWFPKGKTVPTKHPHWRTGRKGKNNFWGWGDNGPCCSQEYPWPWGAAGPLTWVFWTEIHLAGVQLNWKKVLLPHPWNTIECGVSHTSNSGAQLLTNIFVGFGLQESFLSYIYLCHISFEVPFSIHRFILSPLNLDVKSLLLVYSLNDIT